MSLILALLIAVASAGADVTEFSWLSGAWVQRDPSGQWTEEYWTPPRGGLMIGAGLAGKADKLRHFEHMRIATDESGAIAFHAMPNGNPAVVFPLVRWSADEMIFENSSNDYPQRVGYRREGDSIVATISLIDGTREVRWEYRRPN